MHYAVLQLLLQVIAIDGGSPQRTATASVSVTITDANNKNPYFLDDFYSARVNDCEFENRLVCVGFCMYSSGVMARVHTYVFKTYFYLFQWPAS